jgi:hypothetical protein
MYHPNSWTSGGRAEFGYRTLVRCLNSWLRGQQLASLKTPSDFHSTSIGLDLAVRRGFPEGVLASAVER